MEEKALTIQDALEEMGVTFTFPNLRNLSTSNLTYPEFLACVAQRLLLKQYSAQSMDANNFLCPMSRTRDIFNDNKAEFKLGIDELFLKSSTLAIINAQTSKNKVTKQIQNDAAVAFVSWYESNWFDRLKSEELFNQLVETFTDAKIPTVQPDSQDWSILKAMYKNTSIENLIAKIDIEDQIFINRVESIQPKWFDGIFEGCYNFMKLTGNIDLPDFNTFINDEDLIVPTISSFMLSTTTGIEEIEDKKKRYNAPLDTYNLFYTFKETGLSPIFKMNQFVFTTYNYMKILL